MFFYLALQHLAMANASVIRFTSPAMVSILAFLLYKEEFGWVQGLSTVMSMAGVVLVAQPHFIFGAPHVTQSVRGCASRCPVQLPARAVRPQAPRPLTPGASALTCGPELRVDRRMPRVAVAAPPRSSRWTSALRSPRLSRQPSHSLPFVESTPFTQW